MTYPQAYARAAAQIACAMSLLLASCATKPTQTDARANASIQAPAVGISPTSMSETPYAQNLPGLFPSKQQLADGQHPDNLGPVPSQAKPALLPRLTDAIGLSTPTGRAARQQRKDARAAVPRSIGKGAVYAVNSDVVNAFKPSQPVAVARDSATVQVATNAVAGRNNTAAQTAKTEEAKDWKAALATPVGKAVAILGGIVTLLALGGICYYLWPYLPKRKKPEPLA